MGDPREADRWPPYHHHPHDRAPSPVHHLRLRLHTLHYQGRDMITATLTWDLPTTRKDGTPLAPTDIAKVTVVSSENPSSPIDLPPDAVTFTTGDISAQPGEHDYSVTVTDTAGNSSVPVVASVIVPPNVLAAPSPVTNLVATLKNDAAPAPST